MSDVHDDVPTRRWSSPAIQRQPIVFPDRSVYAYALRSATLPPTEGQVEVPSEELDVAVDAEYAVLDLAVLGGDRPLLVRATPRVLSGEQDLQDDGCELVLEVPGVIADDASWTPALRARVRSGVRLAVGDYRATATQDALLDVLRIVKVRAGDPDLPRLAAHAHELGATVIAERADSHSAVGLALDGGADLLQGPMFERDADVLAQEFTAGELQCLELMSLLSEDPVDQAAVIGLVAADPMLTVRVLHLVNSSSFGLPREIDSVRQAVVLVGPHHLSAVAISSLVGAKPSDIGELWAILTRALTCWDLAGTDTGYTVGLLSAVAEQRRMAMETLVSRTGVSQEVADALYFHSGDLGEALAAVVAHEANDMTGVLAAGRDPHDVSQAFLAAVPEALAIASSLSVEG